MAGKYEKEDKLPEKKYSFNKGLENIAGDIEEINKNLKKINKRIASGELDGII